MTTNYLDDLPQNVKEIAEKGNLETPEEVLTTSSFKLLELLNCTESDIGILKRAAAKILAATTIEVQKVSNISSSSSTSTSTSTGTSTSSVSKWHDKWSRITFGCAALDRCTCGGITTRGITEICGVSGVGKTQILLQLSLTVQLPKHLGGLGKATAFVCTEDVFPSKRLHQMVKSFEKRYPQEQINYLGNIYIEHILESDELLDCLEKRLNKLMDTTSIGLIIIDSVAAVYRVEDDYIKRGKEMRKLANCLLRYVERYNCAVICVNQVTNIFGKNAEAPCLGLSWAHLGRTRLKISRVPKQLKIDGKLLTTRKMEIIYSPETPSDFAEFLITEHGVVEVP